MALEQREFECAERLLGYLRDNGLSSSWIPGQDPPDFVFNVKNEVWAVEHTRLMQRIQGASKPVSRRQCMNEDFNCRRGIRAKLGDKLSGDWYLDLQGPFIKDEHKAIEKATCMAISSDDPDLLILELEKLIPRRSHMPYFGDSVSLVKCSSVGSSLVCGSGHGVSARVPHSGEMAADILATNTDAVEHMIQKKQVILTKIAKNSTYNAIVLLLDSQLDFGSPDRISPLLQERKYKISVLNKLFILFQNTIMEVDWES